MSSRQLFEMAKKGMRSYRKALAFAKNKWDLKKRVPLESGTTVEDVIKYVRQRMHLHSHITVHENESNK